MTSPIPSPPAELGQWLLEQGCVPASLEPLAGDVSARRYSRLRHEDGRRLIVAEYPVELREACQRFVTTARLLSEVGINVPPILARDCARGLMLVGDCGTAMLSDFRDQPWAALVPYFEAALEIIRRIGELPTEQVAELCPPLDRALLERELEQTLGEFLVPQGFAAGGSERQVLEQVFAELCATLAAAPMVPCHRDFMARNLVPSPPPPDRRSEETARLWVLDHQDLRLGPPHYDLASLLNDSLFPPPVIEEPLLRVGLGDAADRLPYHRVAAQRSLKAIGTFAKFARLGKRRHLRLVPETLRRALRHFDLLPEAEPVRFDLRRHAELLLLHWNES